MKPEDFDQLLRDKFDEHHVAYNATSWERISSALPSDDRKAGRVMLWSISGIAAALLIAFFFFGLLHDDHQTPVSGQPVAKTDRKQLTPTVPIPAQSVALTHQSGSAVQSVFRNKNSALLTKPLAVQPHEKEVVPPPVPDNQQEANPTTERGKKIVEHHNKSYKNAVIGSENYGAGYKAEAVTSQKPRTQFSLIGGLNYGSLNTGYGAGFNAKRRLSGKLFLEGDVAIIGNTARNSFDPQQPLPGNGSGKPAPIKYEDAHLMYMQFNPAVGYQVLEKLSVGVGADLQQLLTGDDIYVLQNGETKNVPASDYGFTAKTELTLSPKIKAGVQYRHGLNNALRTQGTYLDRNYLQVQLKWTLFGK